MMGVSVGYLWFDRFEAGYSQFSRFKAGYS